MSFLGIISTLSSANQRRSASKRTTLRCWDEQAFALRREEFCCYDKSYHEQEGKASFRSGSAISARMTRLLNGDFSPDLPMLLDSHDDSVALYILALIFAFVAFTMKAIYIWLT